LQRACVREGSLLCTSLTKLHKLVLLEICLELMA